MGTTSEVRYVGGSPARNVPGVGTMVRGTWYPADPAVCKALSESDGFEAQEKGSAKKRPKTTEDER